MSKTIIRISGGLGNQMFQYSLGRALSLRNGSEFVMDLSFYSDQKPGDPVRHYTLDKLSVVERFATKEDFRDIGLPYPLSKSPLSRLRKKFITFAEPKKPIKDRKFITEPNFAFIREILDIKHDAYFSGVWQSDKYFRSAEKVVRNDFKLKQPYSKTAAEVNREISSCESVAIHVRRGDQVSNPHLLKKHGALTDEYYQNAVRYIRAHTKNARFFIFSDEPEWVKANLDIGADAYIVSGRDIPDYEELMLMSSCKHQVVAKSSYSWWGGWLNENPNKIVITPKHRFGSETANDGDLIPETWIRL